MTGFFDRVRVHLQADDPQTLDTSIQAVVLTVIETLPDAAASAVSEATGVPVDPSRAQALDAAGFAVRVQERLKHVEPQKQREIVTATVGVLGTRLSDGPKKLLQTRLPDDLASLMESSGLVEGELPFVEPEAEQATLRDIDLRRAHSRSVVSEDEPRADSKISSASGSAREWGKTIAKDRPHSDNPLSEYEP